MSTVKLALHAMATRFEVVLNGADEVRLRAAGEEALQEIASLEQRLSLYIPTSEIAEVNQKAGRVPVRITPEVFHLLMLAKRLHAATLGTFDPTVGPLVRCWGFMGGTGRQPTEAERLAALAAVGMDAVGLCEADFTVRFQKPGMMLDLGAIGKGYAIERAAALLREAGVVSGLVHGGTSTVCAIGRPENQDSWQIALEVPSLSGGASESLGQVSLVDEALSVSGVWGRQFESEGKLKGHVLDPRTGEPVEGAIMAAVVLPSAAETDGLSTGLLTLGAECIASIANAFPDARCLVAWREKADLKTAERRWVQKQTRV